MLAHFLRQLVNNLLPKKVADSGRPEKQLQTDTMNSSEEWVLRAQQYIDQNDLIRAINAYKVIIAEEPGAMDIHCKIGELQMRAGMYQESVDTWQYLLQKVPDQFQVHHNLALALSNLNKDEDAISHYLRVLSTKPASIETIENLAKLYEKNNKLDEAVSTINKGQTFAPENPVFYLLRAKIQGRSEKFESAQELLSKVKTEDLSPQWSAEYYYELGRINDRLGKFDDAYNAFISANEFSKGLFPSDIDKHSYANGIEIMKGYMLTEHHGNDEPERTARSPVFIVGFPRSGTTLLDQFLDSHSMITTMEEKPVIEDMMSGFSQQNIEGFIGKIAADRQYEVERYFDISSSYVGKGDINILVDRYPLNIVNIPIIQRLFPEARFVIAIRHPCDVCLSCFMQSFSPNAAVANFLNLNDTTQLYKTVMGYLTEILQRSGVNHYTIRYEDLVDNTEHEVRDLLEYIGVPWEGEVLEFYKHAQARGKINTASYHQVTKKIYSHSRYRWHNYKEYLSPYIDTLSPYIEYFGYTEENEM